MKRLLATATLIAFSISIIPNSYAATPKAGAKCSKVGSISTYAGKKFTCIKSGKKLVWNKGVKVSVPKSVATPTPSPTPTPSASASATPSATPTPTPSASASATPSATPTPTPSASASATPSATPTQTPSASATIPANDLTKPIPLYTGGGGSTPGSKTINSFELPAGVNFPTTSGNVKFWIYDPANKNISLAGSNGIFVQPRNGSWTFTPIQANGAYVGTWTEGAYTIDTIEPNGDSKNFSRHRYTLVVATGGGVTIDKLKPNSAGIFTLTVDPIVIKPSEAAFLPTTPCQLLGQDNNLRGNQGFPKRALRLPSSGSIKALFIPVDFPDVPGKGDPAQVYAEMANGMNIFYSTQSAHRVRFDFKILPTFIRMPFTSTFYELGKWNGGDSNGYYTKALEVADPFVDFSQFDVVYVVSPKEIPSSSIAYGPAFLGDISVDDGTVQNGSISGADAWQALPGASWKWISHETGHLFGMHDLYRIDAAPATYGSWDLMSLNWSVKAIGLNAWNRYTQGWLNDDQVKCLTSEAIVAPVDTLITPIERESSLTKAITVKLSSTKILVIESRRNEGFDKLTPSEEGTLIYTVDMTIGSGKGGWVTQRRPGSSAADFMDAALKVGDKIVVDGITIEVISRSDSGDTVRISK